MIGYQERNIFVSNLLSCGTLFFMITPINLFFLHIFLFFFCALLLHKKIIFCMNQFNPWKQPYLISHYTLGSILRSLLAESNYLLLYMGFYLMKIKNKSLPFEHLAEIRTLLLQDHAEINNSDIRAQSSLNALKWYNWCMVYPHFKRSMWSK